MELLILAPPSMHAPLAARFGAKASLQGLPCARRGIDPYDLGALARTTRPRALLAVVPRRRSLVRLVPGPCVAGVPVGVIQADHGSDLASWLATRTHTGGENRLVLAMWKPYYLSLAQRFACSIGAQAAFADCTERETVCRLLAEGPRSAIYIGHGRPQGWSGYRGLRLHHLQAVARKRPIGTVLALACSNLKRRGAEPGFGQQLVLTGAARAFFGAIDNVRIRPFTRIAESIHEAIAARRRLTIGELLADLDARFRSDRDLQSAWSKLRLVGDPLQPV